MCIRPLHLVTELSYLQQSLVVNSKLSDLPAMMAVDLYSGLNGQRLRPSSVKISPASFLAKEKSEAF